MAGRGPVHDGTRPAIIKVQPGRVHDETVLPRLPESRTWPARASARRESASDYNMYNPAECTTKPLVYWGAFLYREARPSRTVSSCTRPGCTFYSRWPSPVVHWPAPGQVLLSGNRGSTVSSCTRPGCTLIIAGRVPSCTGPRPAKFCSPATAAAPFRRALGRVVPLYNRWPSPVVHLSASGQVQLPGSRGCTISSCTRPGCTFIIAGRVPSCTGPRQPSSALRQPRLHRFVVHSAGLYLYSRWPSPVVHRPAPAKFCSLAAAAATFRRALGWVVPL